MIINKKVEVAPPTLSQTLKKTAEGVGVDPAYLSRALRGKQDISEVTYNKLIKITNLTK